jgi:hypothetical protein
MQFTKDFKAGIRTGAVTRSYRAWKKPQAKVGGRYNLHPDGVIEVTAISRVSPAQITDQEAVAAGFADAAALRRFLGTRAKVVLVEFDYLGAGLTGQPARERVVSTELDILLGKLTKMDARSTAPWTSDVLAAIARNPGRRAGDLAPSFDWDTPTFKRQVRKLKALGLTRSLEVGYELSERGEQVLSARS